MFWGKLKEITKIVREIPISDIIVPEDRIRRIVHDNALDALADSIREHGIIEPLIVHRTENVSHETNSGLFVLIAGERRLRAAEILGLTAVPCVSIDANEVDAAVLAIIENLHREDLSMFEEAAAIASLIRLTGMTQEQCAQKLSVSQSYVANKMRLLRLTEEEQTLILENGLTERHSRALLRFDSADERIAILRTIVERHMNVAQAEDYVESMLCAKSRFDEMQAKPAKSEQRMKLVIRDIRLFYNSIDHAVDVIKKSGIAVESTRKETEEGTVISILLPKAG
ncbi:MAG: ParB/RepB/Spo0J family partition protein [Clostridia bacterium]|nr:ParB/RepB/Spo0J family partition protein [Clostridia bacterium]